MELLTNTKNTLRAGPPRHGSGLMSLAGDAEAPKGVGGPPCCISIQINTRRDFTGSALAGEPEKIGAQPSLDSPPQKYDISDPSFIKLKFILSASFGHSNNSWLTGKQ